MTTVTSSKIAELSGQFAIGGDISVNRLGFGAMRITGDGIWGFPNDIDRAKAVLHKAIDLGINFIDTADSYGPETSEQIISDALYPYPNDLVIATKGGLTRQGPNQWLPVGRPEYLKQCVELSLRRLRVETIDLYQLHRFDPLVAKEDTLGCLKEMQDAGKIRHFGLSEVSVEEIELATSIIKVVSVQNLYNLSNRQSEAVVDYCNKNNIGFIPWFPVAAGDLAKPGGILDEAAKAHDATTAQIALAWLLKRTHVMIPIPGTSSPAHVEENAAASKVQLTDEEFSKLSNAVPKQ